MRFCPFPISSSLAALATSAILSIHNQQAVIHYRIPYKGGFQNWDCVQALSIENIIKSLKNVRQNGTIHENKEIKKVGIAQKGFVTIHETIN